MRPVGPRCPSTFPNGHFSTGLMRNETPLAAHSRPPFVSFGARAYLSTRGWRSMEWSAVGSFGEVAIAEYIQPSASSHSCPASYLVRNLLPIISHGLYPRTIS